MFGFEIVFILCMVAINSVLAAYEIALAAVSLPRLHMLRDEQTPGAETAVDMKENMEWSLAVVQLGITLVGALAAATGGAGAEELIAPWFVKNFQMGETLADLLAITVVVVPLTALTIIGGELVPKVFALRNKEWIVLNFSGPMRWFSYSVWPAVWFFEQSVRIIVDLGEWMSGSSHDDEADDDTAHLQELRALASMARTSRLIGAREERIIHSAAHFSNRPVHEIALQPEYISMLAINDSLHDALLGAHRDMHTRFPVTKTAGDANDIIGYVNFKDIVSALHVAPHNPTIRGILRPILSFTDTESIGHCLEQMIHDRSHIAILRSGSGEVTGMVTLEDITEELLGDIQDEHDRLPTHVVGAAEDWVTGGGVTLDRLRSMSGIDLTKDVAEPSKMTLNEWICEQLGRDPEGGEMVRQEGVQVVVRKLRRKRLYEAVVSKIGS